MRQHSGEVPNNQQAVYLIMGGAICAASVASGTSMVARLPF
jgi:hypothetical protein